MPARNQVHFFRKAIEHAPNNPVSGDIRGWWHHYRDQRTGETADIWLCVRCAGRLMDRGVSVSPATPVYRDEAEPYGLCVCCEEVSCEEVNP